MPPPKIQLRVDHYRGCGWRKEGGLYLISAGKGRNCGRLPIPLDVCPTCHAGIKPTRGWTWVDADALRAQKPCDLGANTKECRTCPLSATIGRAGLLWVGEAYYADPKDFSLEAAKLGISRRISAIPNDFKIGETWVLFAHRKAIQLPQCGATFTEIEDGQLLGMPETCGLEPEHLGEHEAQENFQPGIFYMFQPTAIEYVVKGTETDEEIDAMIARGITPVKVDHASGEKEDEAAA